MLLMQILIIYSISLISMQWLSRIIEITFYIICFEVELTDVIISFPRFVFRCVRNGLTRLKDDGVSSTLVRLTAIEDQRRIGTQAAQLVLTFRNLEKITRWIIG